MDNVQKHNNCSKKPCITEDRMLRICLSEGIKPYTELMVCKESNISFCQCVTNECSQLSKRDDGEDTHYMKYRKQRDLYHLLGPANQSFTVEDSGLQTCG
jgi:hypothetical protein